MTRARVGIGTRRIAPSRNPQAGDPLTERELEVARLLADGLSNKLIGDRLGISPHTTKFHVSNVCRKYGTSSRVVAAIKYVRAELVPRLNE